MIHTINKIHLIHVIQYVYPIIVIMGGVSFEYLINPDSNDISILMNKLSDK